MALQELTHTTDSQTMEVSIHISIINQLITIGSYLGLVQIYMCGIILKRQTGLKLNQEAGDLNPKPLESINLGVSTV